MNKRKSKHPVYTFRPIGNSILKAADLIVRNYYRFIHRDYGEVSGQLTMWDFDSGHMEVLIENGSHQPMNIEFVEVIYG